MRLPNWLRPWDKTVREIRTADILREMTDNARPVVRPPTPQEVQLKIDALLDQARRAASCGLDHTWLEVDPGHTNPIRKELRRLGFKVEQGSFLTLKVRW